MNRFFTLLFAASCLTAVGQSEYCLDGTVWDDELQGCIVEIDPCQLAFDYNQDGQVGSSDLLGLLSQYGVEILDIDYDGICDDVDPCVGELDACGACNGPGEVYECGCADIPEGDCDCDGNENDALGVCGGTCEADDNENGLCDANETTGCTDASACNYDVDATFDDGSCAVLDECDVCGGPGRSV